jgi:hypothetical protein
VLTQDKPNANITVYDIVRGRSASPAVNSLLLLGN